MAITLGILDTFNINYYTTSLQAILDNNYILSLTTYNNNIYATLGTSSGDPDNGKVYKSSNGTTWTEILSTGQEDAYASIVYDNLLYVGTSGDAYIYKYDGVSWTGSSFTDNILSFCVYGDKLFIGTRPTGKIYSIETGVPGISLSYDSSDTHIWSLKEYNGNLYACSGDNEGKIFVYNGSSWSLSYDSSETNLRSLEVYRGKLYCAGGDNGKIFVYNGSSWSESYDSSETRFYCLKEYDGYLYAGSATTGRLFIFNTANWDEIVNLSDTHIRCMTNFNNKLYLGTGTSGNIYSVYPTTI